MPTDSAGDPPCSGCRLPLEVHTRAGSAAIRRGRASGGPGTARAPERARAARRHPRTGSSTKCCASTPMDASKPAAGAPCPARRSSPRTPQPTGPPASRSTHCPISDASGLPPGDQVQDDVAPLFVRISARPYTPPLAADPLLARVEQIRSERSRLDTWWLSSGHADSLRRVVGTLSRCPDAAVELSRYFCVMA
jgi:hypothetical protein